MPSTLGIVSSHYTRLPASVSLLLRGNGIAVYSDTFSDLSSNVNPITKVGNVLYKNSVIPFSSIQPNGGSVYFDGDGTNQVLRAPINAFNFGTGNFTVEFWVNPTRQASYNAGRDFTIMGGETPGSGVLWSISVSSYNGYRGLTFAYGQYASYTVGIHTNNWLTANQWQHVAVTRQGTTWRIFVNGVSQTLGIYNEGSTWNPAANFNNTTVTTSRIGGGASNNPYYLSNVRFVNGTALYTSNFTVPTAPLTTTSNGGGGGTAPSSNQVSLLVTGEPLNKGNNDEFPDISNNRSQVTISGKPTQAALTPFAGTTSGSIRVSSGNRLRISSSPSLNILSGDFTIECFVNVVEMPPSFSVVVGQWLQSLNLGGYSMGVFSNGQLFFSFGAHSEAGNLISTTTKSLTAGITSHIAATRSGSNFTLFIDGQSVGSAVFAGTKGDIGVDTTIGNYLNGSNNFPANVGTDLNAYISNLRIVKGTAVYPTTPFPTGPLGNISGTSLLLSTPQPGVVDSVNKNPVIYTNGNSAITTSVKKYGSGSIYFDGNGDYLTVPASNNFNFGSGDFTIEAWINKQGNGTPDVDGNVRLFQTADSAVYTNVSIAMTTNGNIKIYCSNSGSGWDISGLNGGTITNNSWNHFAVVRSGSTIKTYLNGAEQASTSVAGSLYYGNTPCIVGGEAAGRFFNGYIDDLRITRGAIYTKNFTPPTSELPTTDPINLNLL